MEDEPADQEGQADEEDQVDDGGEDAPMDAEEAEESIVPVEELDGEPDGDEDEEMNCQAEAEDAEDGEEE